jgi:hypothetical protein
VLRTVKLAQYSQFLELAQGNESSPPWRALTKDPKPFHASHCIPENWNWVKPHEGDQEAIDTVLERWVADQAAGKPGLEFYNVHASAKGLPKMSTGQKATGRKGKGAASDGEDEEEEEEEEEENDGDDETEEGDEQDEPSRSKRKRSLAEEEDFSKGKWYSGQSILSDIS